MKQNSKIAVFSDLHLGVHLNSSTWHDVSLAWANWIKNELIDKDITDIIFCGDFFHSRSEITVNTLHHASSILDVFKDFNIIMITGNHDCFYKHDSRVNSISILNGRKNIEIIDKPCLKQIGSKELFFAPWGTTVQELQQCDIIFGHFEIESFKMNAYKMCEDGIKSKELLNYAPLIISGHFHLREERKYDNGTILYVGCPFELDFGDTQTTKGYYILDLKDSSYTFYPNEISPKHIKMNLSELIKIDNFNQRGKDLFKNNIIKLAVDKIIDNNDLEKITVKLGGFKPQSLVVDQSAVFDKFGNAGQTDVDLSGVDITQAITDFVNMLDIQNKKEVIDYTIALYSNCK